jgi:hypothetical protein
MAKRLLYAGLLLVSFCQLSCKKTIEKIQENRIIDIMVDGQWIVTQFVEDGVSRQTEFAPYRFQYHRDMTVDAIQNGAVEYTGDWDGDVSTKTTWADFGAVAEPIGLLNGTWQITNNTLTYVLLTQQAGASLKSMRLDKL